MQVDRGARCDVQSEPAETKENAAGKETRKEPARPKVCNERERERERERKTLG